MNTLRTLAIVSVATIIAACSAAPSKPAAVAAPAVADVSGKWLLTVTSPMGSVDGDMVVVQTGKDFKGTIASQMGTVDFTGNVNVNEVKFSYGIEKVGGPPGTIFDYVGTVDGAAMKGKATFATFGEGEWTAKRL